MNDRYESASKYLQTLERSLDSGWQVAFSNCGTHGGSLFEKLSLLHPSHLEQLSLPSYLSGGRARTEIQGPRSFAPGPSRKPCQSSLLWGYECPLDQSASQEDHLFPYSLGGPTVGGNRISLCRYHNMVKTCDIHCFPWEVADGRCESWIDLQINKMKELFDRYT